MTNKIFSITICILFITSIYFVIDAEADWTNPSFILEQNVHSASVWVINGAVSHSFAQEFVLEDDALISEVRVYLKMFSPHPVDFDFAIYVGLSDELTTNYNDWVWYEDIDYSFSGPVNDIIEWECFCGINGEQNYVFSKNTPHYIMIYSPDVDSRICISVLGDDSNPYPNAQAYGEVSTNYGVIEGKDAAFKLWGQLWIEEENHPPNKPTIPSGPDKGAPKQSYTYSTSSTDPDGDSLRYYYDWGDGTDYGWVPEDPETGLGINSHIWRNEGTYSIRVKAKDSQGVESEWSDSLTVKIEQEIEHFAVIVCGGLDEDDQTIFKMDALLTYESFHDYLGYDDDHIYYLDRSRPSGSDASTTKDNVRYAIKNWLNQATSESKICIYMTDHGSSTGCIWIGPNEKIYSYELADWVENLEYKSLTIILQCCYSGNFIDDLKGTDRVILTASKDGGTAHYTPWACSMFTGSLFTWLRAYDTYGDAFDKAEAAVQGYGDNPSISDQSGIAYKTYPGYSEDDSDDDPITVTKNKDILNNIVLRLRFLHRNLAIKILNLLDFLRVPKLINH